MSGTDFADLVVQVHTESVAIADKAMEDFAQTADRVEARVSRAMDKVSAGMRKNMTQANTDVQRNMTEVEQKFETSAQRVQRGAADTMNMSDRQIVSSSMAMSNLTAQYNDIFVMMAAGQNPIQLALQQGTQINQVYGDLQARGLPIISSLTGAFMNMIKPINLLTIASIAAAGAFVNWMMSGKDAAKIYETSIEEGKDAVEQFSKWMEVARRSNANLNASLAVGSGQTEKYAKTLAGLSEAIMFDQMGKGLKVINDDLQLTSGRMNVLEAKAVAIGSASFNWINFREIFSLSRDDMTAAMVADVQTMREAYMYANNTNNAIENRLTAMRTLAEITARIATADGSMDPESKEGQLVTYLVEQVDLIQQYVDTKQSSAKYADEEIGTLTTQTELLRLGLRYGEDSVAVRMRQLEIDRETYALKQSESGEVNADDLARIMVAYDAESAAKRLEIIKDVWRGIAASAADYFDTVVERSDTIKEQTKELTLQGNIMNATRIFGADSVVVARLRLQAERDNYSAYLDQEKIVGATKDRMMALWDTANGVASVDLSGNITAAVGQTYSWADAMGAVLGQINGIIGAMNTLAGGAIASAGNKAQADALRNGASVAEARRIGEATRMEAEYDAKIDAAWSSGDYAGAANLGLERANKRRDAREKAEISGLEDDTREREKAERKAERDAGKKTNPAPKGFARDKLDFTQEIRDMEEQEEKLTALLNAGGDWRRELELLEAKQELLNEAQMRGIKITPALEKEIDKLAEEYVNASDALSLAKDRLQYFQDAMQDMRGSLGGAFSGLITGAHSFRDALSGVISKLADMAADRAFNWIWSGNGMGSGDNGLLGSLVSSAFGGFREGGGDVSAGKAYVVGEKRAELFVPKSDGYIMPEVPGMMDAMPESKNKNGGVSYIVIEKRMSIQPSEMFTVVMEEATAQASSEAIAQYDKNLNSRIDRYGNDTRVRGGT